MKSQGLAPLLPVNLFQTVFTLFRCIDSILRILVGANHPRPTKYGGDNISVPYTSRLASLGLNTLRFVLRPSKRRP